MNAAEMGLPPALGLPGLISFWDFQEPAGSPRIARGPHACALLERDGAVERTVDGVFGPGAARFGGGAWLCAPRASCPALDLHGPAAQSRAEFRQPFQSKMAVGSIMEGFGARGAWRRNRLFAAGHRARSDTSRDTEVFS